MKIHKTLVCAAIVCSALSVAPAFARGGGGGSHGGGSHSHSSSSGGSHSISSYTRSNGTYVAPSHGTNPNGTRRDNWSTKGNVNPYTGKPGTKSAD